LRLCPGVFAKEAVNLILGGLGFSEKSAHCCGVYYYAETSSNIKNRAKLAPLGNKILSYVG
jgi:hypothetical protein